MSAHQYVPPFPSFPRKMTEEMRGMQGGHSPRARVLVTSLAGIIDRDVAS